jgi:hypothetical protein
MEAITLPDGSLAADREVGDEGRELHPCRRAHDAGERGRMLVDEGLDVAERRHHDALRGLHPSSCAVRRWRSGNWPAGMCVAMRGGGGDLAGPVEYPDRRGEWLIRQVHCDIRTVRCLDSAVRSVARSVQRTGHDVQSIDPTSAVGHPCECGRPTVLVGSGHRSGTLD